MPCKMAQSVSQQSAGSSAGTSNRRRWGAAVLLLSVAMGCHPPDPVVAEPRVWDVSVGQLIRSAPSYVGEAVRVRLPADSYTVTDNAVSLKATGRNRPTTIVFYCRPRQVPEKTDHPIALEGVVPPVVHDKVWRSAGVDWETHVVNCTVTVLPTPSGPLLE